MSMDHFLWPLLYFLFPLATIAGQLTASLAPSLIARIPPCAQACVESLVLEEFPASLCPPKKDLGCLCTGTSTSGLTLGEGSLRCVAANCANRDLTSDWLVYEICSGINGAVSMTHKTLTATQAALVISSTSTRKSTHSSTSFSSHRLSSKKSTSSTVTSHISTSRSQATSTSSASVLTPSSKPHSSTSASTTPSQPPSVVPGLANKKALSKPQIAGIIVAGVAIVAVIIGIVLFLCCVRRKRSKKRSSSPSFVGDKGVLGLADTPSLPDARNRDMEQGRMSRDYAIVGAQHGSVAPKRNNDSQTSLLGGNFHPDDIGVALAPEISTAHATSPSAASDRTASTLLPDKPAYSLFPSPLRIKSTRCQKNSASSPLLGEAGARQANLTPSPRPSSQARDTSQRQLQHGYSPLLPSASDPFLDAQYKSHSRSYSNQQRRHLRLETPSNDRSSPGLTYRSQSMGDLHKPVATHQSTRNGHLTRNGAAYASISPSEYTGRPVFDTLGASQSQPRKPIPARSRRSMQRRPSARYSTASETSFETIGDDDETPPLPAILPPVQESSGLRSANGHVTSLAPGHFGITPELESPTRKPIRRKQPQPAPLVTQNLAQRKPKGILKPLSDVPELSNGHAGRFSSTQNAQTPATLATECEGEVDGVRRTAKYQILVSPGLRGIHETGTPKSGKSVEWAPSPPTARSPTTPTRTGEIRVHPPLSPTIKFVR